MRRRSLKGGQSSGPVLGNEKTEEKFGHIFCPRELIGVEKRGEYPAQQIRPVHFLEEKTNGSNVELRNSKKNAVIW